MLREGEVQPPGSSRRGRDGEKGQCGSRGRRSEKRKASVGAVWAWDWGEVKGPVGAVGRGEKSQCGEGLQSQSALGDPFPMCKLGARRRAELKLTSGFYVLGSRSLRSFGPLERTTHCLRDFPQYLIETYLSKMEHKST